MDEQPIGARVAFEPATRPNQATVLRGRHVLLRRPDPDRDARPLYEATHPLTGDPASGLTCTTALTSPWRTWLPPSP